MESAVPPKPAPSAEQAIMLLREHAELPARIPAYLRITGFERIKVLRAIEQALAHGLSLTRISWCLGIPKRKLVRWRAEARTTHLGIGGKYHRPPGSLCPGDILLLMQVFRKKEARGWSCRKIKAFIFRRHGKSISHVSVWKYKKLLKRDGGVDNLSLGSAPQRETIRASTVSDFSAIPKK